MRPFNVISIIQINTLLYLCLTGQPNTFNITSNIV